LGGVLTGYGARLARGCTSGLALSGGAVLSAGAWAFMMAVFAAGFIGAYFVRRYWI
ncbi:MAG: YeeE/YedE thiosulfate transporter family protein, partial [Terriglobia bacterium]